MPGGPFPFDDSASDPVSRLLVFLVLLSGCVLARGPQTLAERTADTRRRLSAAETPAARRTTAVRLLAGAGLSPVAGLRGTGSEGPDTRYTSGRLVGGFVPGRSYGVRDTLVVVAAALDGPHAATLIETARLLTARADSRGDAPERSVLVVLWDTGMSAHAGLTAVRAFPLWPRGAVRVTLLLADSLPADVDRIDPEHALSVFQTAGLPAETSVSGLYTSVLLAASPAPHD